MATNWNYADPTRVEFRGQLTPNEIGEVVSNPRVRVLQSSSPTEPGTWDLLNDTLCLQRPDIELRVYGFDSSVCDLSFVSRLSNARRFSADCLMHAIGVENLACMKSLEELSVGIYDLQSFDFLASIPVGIRKLWLWTTKSKKPRLNHLARFHSLRLLFLEGQQQGIEVLSDLKTLEDVTLRSISTQNVEYISKLPLLWSLDIKLGGIRDFSSLIGKESIKYLELWMIRGLADLGFVSTFTGLQFLFLQDLRNVIGIPDLSRLNNLRRLSLANMKGLQDVSAIFSAPALEEFNHTFASNIPPERYADLLSMPKLKSVHVAFGSRKKNDAFAERVRQAGKTTDWAQQFDFR